MRRNLARTTQTATPVLHTEITNVCVFPDLLAMIVKTVGNSLTQLSNSAVKTGAEMWLWLLLGCCFCHSKLFFCW